MFFKYIRVDIETSPEDMFAYMTNETGFRLTKPKLIISVTGGTVQFSIDEETKKAFKSAIMKIAKSTDAWIISGGMNKGVMSLVGDAVADDPHATNQPVIGIASWGCVASNEDLIVIKFSFI